MPLPQSATPNYNFALPTVGGDTNVWGTLLNENWSLADGLFKNAFDGLNAVTDVSVGPTAPATAKGGDFWLDTSSTPRLKVFVAGSPGVWTLAAPVQTPPVALGATAPASPSNGDLWYNTASQALFLRSGNAWVQLTNLPAEQQVPTGAFMWHTGRSAPSGYRLANGAALASTDAPAAALRALYLADGSPYGVSGANPLMPNLMTAQRFIRAPTAGTGVGVTQTDAFQDHGHRITRTQGGGSGGSGEWIGTNDTPGNTTRDNRVTIPVAGSQGAPRTASETRPVNIALLPCVKL